MRNFAELGAILTIGDGVAGSVAPRRHSLLWKFLPEGYRRVIEAQAERPGAVRGFARLEVLIGLWLASRQYQEG